MKEDNALNTSNKVPPVGGETTKAFEPSGCERLWLHADSVKSLAWALRRCGLKNHCKTLDAICRSAGFQGYNQALHSPRATRLSFQEWQVRLTRELEANVEALLSEEELRVWFGRLFSQGASDEGRDGEEGDLFDRVPSDVSHEQTIADWIARGNNASRGILGKGGRPPRRNSRL